MVLCSACQNFDLPKLIDLTRDWSVKIEARRQVDRDRMKKVCPGNPNPPLPPYRDEEQPPLYVFSSAIDIERKAIGGCGFCRLLRATFPDLRSRFFRESIVVISSQESKLNVQTLWFSGEPGTGFFNGEYTASPLGTFEFYRARAASEIFDNFSKTFDRPIRVSQPFQRIATDPKTALGQWIRHEWLQGCVSGHDECAVEGGSAFLPARVIDVGCDTDLPRLYESQPNERGSWAALSYCWGPIEPRRKLTESNLAEMLQALPLADLDQTIQDAICVTRCLSLRYLWVDSLCIFQHHGSKEWLEQSEKMNEIYGNSTVTLAAARADIVQAGFLQPRHHEYFTFDCSNASSTSLHTDKDQVHIALACPPGYDRPHGPLMCRGWVMQELLLPKRILFFTDNQMIWKCHRCIISERGVQSSSFEDDLNAWKNSASEDNTDGIWLSDLYTKFKHVKEILQARKLVNFERHRLWWDIVAEYSQRSFSRVDDRIVAISGIALEYAERTGDEAYCAGLWENDLPCGLLWKVADEPPLKLFPAKKRKHCANFASWSWANAPLGSLVTNQLAAEHFSSITGKSRIQRSASKKLSSTWHAGEGTITISGPTIRLERLYDKQYLDEKCPMSALQRYLSSIVWPLIKRKTQALQLQKPNKSYAVLMAGQSFPAHDTPQFGVQLSQLVQLLRLVKITSLPLVPSPFLRVHLLVLGTDRDLHNLQQPIYTRVGALELDAVNHCYDPVIPVSPRWLDALQILGDAAEFSDTRVPELVHSALDGIQRWKADHRAARTQPRDERLEDQAVKAVLRGYNETHWPVETLNLV